MTSEENKQLVGKFYYELYNQHNLAVIDDCLSDDYVSHEYRGPGFGEINRTSEDMKEMARRFYTAFPDQKSTFDEIKTQGTYGKDLRVEIEAG